MNVLHFCYLFVFLLQNAEVSPRRHILLGALRWALALAVSGRASLFTAVASLFPFGALSAQVTKWHPFVQATIEFCVMNVVFVLISFSLSYAQNFDRICLLFSVVRILKKNKNGHCFPPFPSFSNF